MPIKLAHNSSLKLWTNAVRPRFNNSIFTLDILPGFLWITGRLSGGVVGVVQVHSCGLWSFLTKDGHGEEFCLTVRNRRGIRKEKDGSYWNEWAAEDRFMLKAQEEVDCSPVG